MELTLAQMALDPPDNLTVIWVASAVFVTLGGGFVSLLVVVAKARRWVADMVKEAQSPVLAELHALNKSVANLGERIHQILLDDARADGAVTQLQEEMREARQTIHKLVDRVTRLESSSG